jgi:hypothetical protein
MLTHFQDFSRASLTGGSGKEVRENNSVKRLASVPAEAAADAGGLVSTILSSGQWADCLCRYFPYQKSLIRRLFVSGKLSAPSIPNGMREQSKNLAQLKNIRVELTPVGERYLQRNQSRPIKHQSTRQEIASGQVLRELMKAIEGGVIGSVT